MAVKAEATIGDLYHVPKNGKVEIVKGELHLMFPPREICLAPQPEKSLFPCTNIHGGLGMAAPTRTMQPLSWTFLTSVP